MEKITLDRIKSAGNQVYKLIKPSPVQTSVFLSNRTGVDVVLKLESLNRSGSFKIRGATNALSLAGAKARSVVAASAGNHAQAVAHVCAEMGITCNIFMPERSPLIKIKSTLALGANVHLEGESLNEATEAAEAFLEKNGGMFLHPFANEDVICGQGTAGLEMYDQITDLDMCIVPIGGGGLISGIAVALKNLNPKIKIIGVQSTAYAPVYHRLKTGKNDRLPQRATIADGIATKMSHDMTFQVIQKYVDDVICVEETAIASAILELMERNALLAEGAGAASVAGLLDLADQNRLGKKVACVLSGGNIDVNLLNRIAVRGLVSSGRLCRIRIKVSDAPGSIAKVLQCIGNQNANLMETYHHRMFTAEHFSDVEIDLDIETMDTSHRQRVLSALEAENIEYRLLH